VKAAQSFVDIVARQAPEDRELLVDLIPVPALLRVRRDGGHTIPARRGLSGEEIAAGKLLDTPDVERPRTRGDCASMPRPCPFVNCGHHLYLDVEERTGSLKLNFPHLEPWELAETCALDVADRGGTTLEAAGALVNITRERVRQVEERILRKLRGALPEAAT